MFRRSLTALTALIPALLIAAPAELAAQDAIALAVAPLPSAGEQAGAKVIRKQGSEWVTLREGTGMFICIADDASDDRFHSSCYHKSLEPYMARGRELAAGGATGGESVQTRIAEIEAGTLEMPSYAFLHSIFAAEGWSGDMEAVQAHFSVIYTPFAKAEDLGLPTERTNGAWLMASGMANSHIMITP
ncbi:hypothetical protein [Candidatus Palauibacter sp.]|uniref:hypothetical protein n=1 Tax=Candidatus Palauibacter sp. TaxID=3101350 RepID=UPI003AF2403A